MTTKATTNKTMPDDAPFIAANLHKMIAANTDLEEAKADHKKAFKSAEAKGINMQAAKDAIAIIKGGKVDEAIAYTQAFYLYLRVLRHGVTDNQLSLDLSSSLAPIDERAAEDGRFAGMSGDDVTETDNPHALSTKAGQAWLAAFRDGRKQRDTILAMKDEDADEGDED